jgi:hypothetical protein
LSRGNLANIANLFYVLHFALVTGAKEKDGEIIVKDSFSTSREGA